MTWWNVFAYGSNLFGPQMRERCPSHYVIGRAGLGGHRLAFAGHSARWDGGVATLDEAPTYYAPGLLYALNDAELARLDRFEGSMYERRTMRVRYRKRLLSAYVYVQRSSALLAPPSERYVERIRAGYAAHGFDARLLASALRYTAHGSGRQLFAWSA